MKAGLRGAFAEDSLHLHQQLERVYSLNTLGDWG